MRVGGDLRPPAKLRHVNPAYPELARITRTSGTVVLECLNSPTLLNGVRCRCS